MQRVKKRDKESKLTIGKMEKRYEGWGISEAVTSEVTKTKELQRMGEIKALALVRKRNWKTEQGDRGVSNFIFM